MQTYQKMKDSGVAWLGDIPSEWDQKQARYIFKQTKDSVGEDPSKYELLSLTLRGIIPRSQVDGGKNPENYSAYQIVRENDLVMCLFDYDVTPRTVGLATSTGMVTGAYTNLRPLNGISTRYFNYFFLALDTTKELLHLCTGLRNGISKQTFFSLNLPVPEYETQEIIADYLDEETAKIDDLISKQEHLLKLIEEKKKATINWAVTKGINPTVELASSGVTWIGQMPEHWQIKQIKHISPVKRGASPRPIEDPKYFDKNGEFNWVRIADVTRSGKYLLSTPQKLSILGASLSVKQYPGDIFVSIAASVGKPMITKIQCCIHDGFVYFPYIDEKMIEREFLYYIFDAGQCYLGLGKMGTQLNLNTETIGSIKIAIPPLDEQLEIVEWIRSYEKEYGKLKALADKQVVLLKERRMSLVSNAVTGKVRV
ncbi:restriction endonuclease subunit S [Candidatus Saccharibacteria bacterium]|nr:restriction endonuclease subunit S [Candidatus Saccharibacteria bacterium]